MKKQILIACGVLITSLGFGQEKFYTSNFSKEVKELNASMNSVGFVTVLPSTYTKYDDIVAVIDSKDEGLDDYYTLNFYYHLLPTKEVPADRKVKYVIKSASNKRSDFTSLFRTDMDVAFDLLHDKTLKTRTYRYQTVVVKVMGRKQDGMHWVNGEYVPKWNYEELSFSEIKLDLGEPDPIFTTAGGLFTYKKYTTGEAFTKIIPSDDSEDLQVVYAHGPEYASEITFSIYEIKAGEIKQETFDMSGPAPKASKAASVEDMISEIKLNIKKELIKSSCYNEARSVKLEGQRLAETKVSEGIYAPYMLDAGKGQSNASSNALGSLKAIGGQFVKQNGSGDKYNKFINSAESDLKWEEKKLGSATFEFLELDLYQYKQCQSSSSNKTMTIKEGQEGKTQKVIVFIGKIDGKLYAGSFTKNGEEDWNEEDLKFKNYMLNTFVVNK
jgi:hypothetical protein